MTAALSTPISTGAVCDCGRPATARQCGDPCCDRCKAIDWVGRETQRIAMALTAGMSDAPSAERTNRYRAADPRRYYEQKRAASLRQKAGKQFPNTAQ